MTLVARCRRHRVSACLISRVLAQTLINIDAPGELTVVRPTDGDGWMPGTYWIAPHECKGAPSGVVPYVIPKRKRTS